MHGRNSVVTAFSGETTLGLYSLTCSWRVLLMWRSFWCVALQRLRDFRSSMYMYRVLRPCVSLYTPENYTLQAKLKNVKPHHRDSNQGPSAYRADVLTAALWCSSHPQRRKHDISLTCFHLLATLTTCTQVGLWPQTIVGSTAKSTSLYSGT